MATFPCLSASFCEGEQLPGLSVCFLDDVALSNEVNSYRKECAPTGAFFFFQGWSLFRRKAKLKMVVLLLLNVYPFTLKRGNYFDFGHWLELISENWPCLKRNIRNVINLISIHRLAFLCLRYELAIKWGQGYYYWDNTEWSRSNYFTGETYTTELKRVCKILCPNYLCTVIYTIN